MENGGSTQMLKTLRFHHENDEQLSRVFLEVYKTELRGSRLSHSTWGFNQWMDVRNEWDTLW
jgi:hypothetical protein